MEIAYITLQGARGVSSHFNRTTPWEAAAGVFMAAGAGFFVAVTMWIGWVLLRHAARTDGSLTHFAMGLGCLVGGFLAGWTGGQMGPSGYWPQPLQQPVQFMPLTG